MEELRKLRNAEEEKKLKEWMNYLVTEALEQEEVEDFLYEHRWEFYDEESKRMICRLYPLWAARVCNWSKEEMEALYHRGYRYIHKSSPKGVIIEVIEYGWGVVQLTKEKDMLVNDVVSIIIQTIEADRYPAVLLNEYDQLEQELKERIRCELFVKMMDDYGVKEGNGEKQEMFLQKMEKLFPAVYKDWMEVSVTELLFCIKEKIDLCAKYMEQYHKYHKRNRERIQDLKEYLSNRQEE